MNESAHEVMWRRLRYLLTPQFDLYLSIAEKLSGKPNVLEVGFGTGAGVLLYAHNVSFVHAIDVDPGAVTFAKTMFPLSNVTWMTGDITKFNSDRKYTAAVMVETLEHIHDWRRALQNVWDHLDLGGDLIITARNANADLRRWKELHEREWKASEFRKALLEVFQQVWLYDWSLKVPQDDSSTLTPLVAIARKN